MIKYLLFLPMFFIFISCYENEKLNGLWYGESNTEQLRKPILMKFNNGKTIEYFITRYDTVDYRLVNNKIYFITHGNKEKQYNVEISETSLIAFDTKSDSFVFKINKKRKPNFIFDYLNDESLQINLPSGKGIEKTFGKEYRLDFTLYLAYKENKLIANFADTSLIVNDEYYRFLNKKLRLFNEIDLNFRNPHVLLIADKNIKIPDLNLVRKQLSIARFTSVDYMLSNQQYDKLNFFGVRLKRLTEEELNKYDTPEDTLNIPIKKESVLEWSSSYKGQLLFVEVNQSVLKLNDSLISIKELIDVINKKNNSEEIYTILYYLTSNSNYQDYIQFYGFLINNVYDARDDYLMKKYGFKYRDTSLSKSRKVIDAQKEVHKTIPLRLIELKKKNFEKIKSNF